MNHKTPFTLSRIIMAATAISLSPASGATIHWNLADSGDWETAANWNPAQVPGIADDAIIGDIAGTQGKTTSLSTIVEVGSVSLVSGNRLLVNGAVLGRSGVLDADWIDVSDGGFLKLSGGHVIVSGGSGDQLLEVTNGTLGGYGTIDLNVNGDAVRLQMTDSELRVGYMDARGPTTGDPARTLKINAASDGGLLHLDGGSSTITLLPAATLEANAKIDSPCSSTLHLYRKSTLDAAWPWQFSGVMTIDTETGALPGQNAGPATIAGETFTLRSDLSGNTGTINLDEATDHLIFAAPFDTNGSVAVDFQAGTLQFDADATIGANCDFQVGPATKLLVNGKLTVNDHDWDWDGNGGNDNQIEIGPDGTLEANLTDSAADVSWHGYMKIHGGSLKVQAYNNHWSITNRMELEGGSSVSGDTVDLGDGLSSTLATLEAFGGGTVDFTAPLTLRSDAVVQILSGTTLRTGILTFKPASGQPGGAFTGEGTWKMAGTNTIDEETTINMTGGTVDLDNSSPFTILHGVANDTYLNANLTINVAELSSYGARWTDLFNNVSRSDLNIADGAKLTVNLDNALDTWTVTPDGIINYNGDASTDTFLAGAALHMNGTLNLTGDGRSTVILHIGGVANLETQNHGLRLAGGNLILANTLDGGTIDGPGSLMADAGHALFGHGTINAPIRFDGDSQLLATGGTLTINHSISDLGELGAASGAVLDIPSAWNSFGVDLVRMKGGELTGGALTLANTEGLKGSGTVSPPVVNNSQIIADSPGNTLVLTHADGDWDGTSDTGKLGATSNATLEIHDDERFDFHGTIEIDSGGTVSLDDFPMLLEGTSKLNVNNGTLRHSGYGPMPILGVTTIEGTSTFSATRPESGYTFLSGIWLNGTLRLDAPISRIQASASFSTSNPTHVIEITPGCRLNLEKGATVLGLHNSGTLRIALNGTATAAGYEQTSGATLGIDIGGTAPGQFDVLKVYNSATLAGSLALFLTNSFVPTAGQSFTILNASWLNGTTFQSIIQPANMPADRAFQVRYTSTSVILDVVAITNPFDAWINSFASLTNPADRAKDADPDGDGLNNLAEFALDGDPSDPVATGKYMTKITTIGGTDYLTVTTPVRNGAIQPSSDPAGGELVLQQNNDGLIYKIQAGDDLSAWPLDVYEITGSDAQQIQSGLPPLHAGWSYRSFRTSTIGHPKAFIRVKFSE